MNNKIKTVKIKNEDGSVSTELYNISADAQNVDMPNGFTVQETIGTIDVENDGSIAQQIDNINNNIDDIELDIINMNNKIIKKPYYFNTVAEMKNANLQIGDYAITLGYYEPNDGGAGEYKIVNEENQMEYSEKLSNNLYALLIIKEEVNPVQFGCRGNGIIDDTTNFQKMLDFISIRQIPVYINKLFLVNNLKLKAYEPNNIIYNLRGIQSNQRGHNAPSIKTGFLTNTNVFTTDELVDTNIQIHFDSINAENLGNSGSNCFIYNCDISRSSILNCSITNFDYIIYGSTSGATNISYCNLKNIKKACFRVGDTSSRGFYDSLISNNYINAKHETTGFHGRPEKRTCVIFANRTLGFGEDGRFVNNFVDYFTYFIDAGKEFEIGSTPTYLTLYTGNVSNNVFQYMLNMIGIGIIMRGYFENNCFYEFCKDPIYNYLDNTNAGPFSIATYTCEISNAGDNTETYPYRKIECSKIVGNLFKNCDRPIYYDFDNTYPGLTNSTFRPSTIVIKDNECDVQPFFNDRCVFACNFNNEMFYNLDIQMWKNIVKLNISSSEYPILKDGKMYANFGTKAQFNDGIFTPYYVSNRVYRWLKIADIPS